MEKPSDNNDATDRLYRAAEAGDAKGIRAAIADGANPNHLELTRGGSPLDWAMSSGNLPACRALLEAGANPDIGLWDRLDRCVEERLDRMADLLLEHGADPNGHPDREDGEDEDAYATPLIKAVIHNRSRVALALLEAGADANRLDIDGHSALYWARFNKRKKLIAALEARTSPEEQANAKYQLSTQAKERERRDDAILAAMEAGDLALATRLVDERPEDVNEPLVGTSSLLTIAASNMRLGLRPLVEHLIEAGARPDLDSTMPALYYIAITGDKHPDLVEKAIRASETVDPPTLYDGETPLMVTVRQAQPQTAALLLAHGADVNARDHRGHSVLWHARQWEQWSKGVPNPVIPILVEAGATD